MLRSYSIVFIIVACILSPVHAFGRVHTLPADSIAFPTQMYSSSDTLPDVRGLIRYGRNQVWLNPPLVDCYARIPLSRGVVLGLDIVENMMEHGTFRLCVHGLKGDVDFTLNIPQEAYSQLYVNGHEVPMRTKRGYTIISRKWRNGHEVLLRR